MTDWNKPFWAETPPLDSLALMSSASLLRARLLDCSASSSLPFSRPWYLAICWSSSSFSYRKTDTQATDHVLTSAETPAPAARFGYKCTFTDSYNKQWCLLKLCTFPISELDTSTGLFFYGQMLFLMIYVWQKKLKKLYTPTDSSLPLSHSIYTPTIFHVLITTDLVLVLLLIGSTSSKKPKAP